MTDSVKNGLKRVKVVASNAKASLVVATCVGASSVANAAGIAAPDMTDATSSVTNVFGAVLGVAVLIFGFKKVKSLL